MLEIKNLNVEIKGKNILRDINLRLEKGKIYALMGPNGSGKSTLANVLMGNKKYKINSGEILLDGENIEENSTNEIAKKGLFLSYQNPVEVPGVTISNFLRTVYNSIKENKLSLLEFKKLLEKKAEDLQMDKIFLMRYLNDHLSGGEKKKTEILQMLVLDPKVVILDEIDSGLDVDSLRNISENIKKFADGGKTMLIITHYRRILDHINPDKVFVIKNGEITKSFGKSVIDKIEKEGYKWIKK